MRGSKSSLYMPEGLAWAFQVSVRELLKVGNGTKDRKEEEATHFVFVRRFETGELRFIGLLLMLSLRWKKAAPIRSEQGGLAPYSGKSGSAKRYESIVYRVCPMPRVSAFLLTER